MLHTSLRNCVKASLVLVGGLSLSACSNSSSPTGGGTSSDYCSAISSYATRCNVTNACLTATENDCSALASAYSGATLATVSACLNAIPCGDAGANAAAACFQIATSKGAPTAAQTKLAQDYCAVCAGSQTTAECASTFFTTTAGDSGVTVATGPGNGLLGFSDTVATTVDTKCVPALGDGGLLACAATFRICEAQVSLAALPTAPAACTGGTTAGDGG